jgi:hypothetical protein
MEMVFSWRIISGDGQVEQNYASISGIKSASQYWANYIEVQNKKKSNTYHMCLLLRSKGILFERSIILSNIDGLRRREENVSFLHTDAIVAF